MYILYLQYIHIASSSNHCITASKIRSNYPQHLPGDCHFVTFFKITINKSFQWVILFWCMLRSISYKGSSFKRKDVCWLRISDLARKNILSYGHSNNTLTCAQFGVFSGTVQGGSLEMQEICAKTIASTV